MSPHDACFSSRGGENVTSSINVCNYSSFLIKYRVPPLPVPACGLSACETPCASCDGQSNTSYLVMSLGDLTGQMLHIGWTGSAPRKSTYILGARTLAEEDGQLRESTSVFKLRGAYHSFRMGRGVHTPWSPSITCHQNVRVASMNSKSEFGNH